MGDAVSVVVTSCGRIDLLNKTLESFLRFNTYKNIAQIIIIDDSGHFENVRASLEKILENLRGTYEIEVIVNRENLGQVRSIDIAYSLVKHPYIFHLEDDWEFYQPSFIEYSLEILKKYPWIITVWLRSHLDTNGHPIEFINGLPFGLLQLNYLNCWHGFTWNPGLRRLCDYKLIKNFSEHAPGENSASIWYMKKGFRASICSSPNGFVKHIGWDRSTSLIPGAKKAT